MKTIGLTSVGLVMAPSTGGGGNSGAPKGSYNLVSDLELTLDATNEQIAAALGEIVLAERKGDYAFVLIPSTAEAPTVIERSDRYEFDGTGWMYMYPIVVSQANWEQEDSGAPDFIKNKPVWLLSAVSQVLVEAVTSIRASFDGFAARFANLGETKAVCIDFENMPKICGQSLVVGGSGAPSVPPAFVGQRYHDTTNDKCYEAFHVTGATSDWKLLN